MRTKRSTSTVVLTIVISGLYLLIFYLPAAMFSIYAFRGRNYLGGVEARFEISSWLRYDYAALLNALLLTIFTSLCVIVILTSIAFALVCVCRLSLSQGQRRVLTAACLSLFLGDGLVKALTYREAFGFAPSTAIYIFESALMLAPLYVVIVITASSQIPNDILLAARDLGAGELTIARRVILPAVLPAMKVASTSILILIFFNFVYVEAFLGGKRFLLANLIRQQYLVNADWPSAAITVMFGLLFLGGTILASNIIFDQIERFA